MDLDCELLELYDKKIQQLELFLARKAKTHDPRSFYLLRSISGIGKILAMTILYEIHDIGRFETVGSFASYSRLVKYPHESAGKPHGFGGAKMGKHLFELGLLRGGSAFTAGKPHAQQLKARLEKKYGKQKALTYLAHKIGRAVYFMLKRHQPFDSDRFYTNMKAA